MNDDMLSKSNEDLFSVPTYLKIDPETQRDVQLRLGYTTRYCEDDEIKIMVYNDFKKGENWVGRLAAGTRLSEQWTEFDRQIKAKLAKGQTTFNARWEMVTFC